MPRKPSPSTAFCGAQLWQAKGFCSAIPFQENQDWILSSKPMEKRLILAMALSMLFLFIWQAMLPKPQHIENKVVIGERLTSEKPAEAVPSSSSRVTVSSDKIINYAQPKFDISFIEDLAAIKEIRFKDYQEYAFPLQYALLSNGHLSFKALEIQIGQINFTASDKDKSFTKSLIFNNSNYNLLLNVEVRNLTNSAISFEFPMAVGVLDFSHKDENSRYKDVVLGSEDKVTHIVPKKDQVFDNVDFIGIRDRYFCEIIQPQDGPLSAYIRKLDNQQFEIGFSAQRLQIQPNQPLIRKFSIYMGPQELKLIQSSNPQWSAVIHYGTFDFISQILFQLLQFFYRVVHNWGMAIILLSIAIYLLLFPLTVKQMRSMKEMQALQPHIEELKRLYKDNPQRMQKEQMELFKKHKVNPFGGCLPLLLQMPIFFALYQTLMRSVFLRGASFLWIKDLSGPDHLFSLPFPKPFDAFNLLPILMSIGMFFQQKISTASTAANGSAAEQQKMMMIMMPLMFGFIFYSMPSGLVLYWFTNSALMLANQTMQLRHK
jgi:YidC/Oxa1 family membrane protein insertase